MTTALVTGASSGIGREIAKLLHADGHDVVLMARRKDELEALAHELGGARTRVIPVDLAAPGAVGAVVSLVPDVDVLVNNAGYGDYGTFHEADPHKTIGMIQLNVVALTELTRHYLPGMVARRHGKVLNVASTAAFQPGPLMSVYYATKAYVLSFSEGIAEELRGTGVTVTALCPGPTSSGFQDGAAMGDSKLVQGRKLPTAASVARAGLKAMNEGKVVFVPGLSNKLGAMSVRFVPRAWVRRIVRRAQRPG
jgi:short-subunit dehydrogenase